MQSKTYDARMRAAAARHDAYRSTLIHPATANHEFFGDWLHVKDYFLLTI